jgi:hypothetical protein
VDPKTGKHNKNKVMYQTCRAGSKQTVSRQAGKQASRQAGKQAADSRQQTADSRQQTADSRQQTANSKQQTADSRQRTEYFPQAFACSRRLLLAQGSKHTLSVILTMHCRGGREKEGKKGLGMHT